MNKKIKTLVISNSPLLAYNAACCLYDWGCLVDAIVSDQFSPFEISKYWHKYIKIEADWLTSSNNSDTLVKFINDYCCRHKIDIIVPADVTSNLALLKNSNKIQFATLFPTPSDDQFIQLNNKWSFANLANKCHASHPQTWLLEKPEQIQDFVLEFPVIVKPLAESGGKGVYRVKSFQQLSHYVQDCFQSEDLPILIQEHIEGYDLDLTILANHGEVICWTIQKRRMEESGMEFLVDESILNLGRSIVAEINYHGVVDFDIRYDINRQIPVLIEANPRFPGSLRFKLWSGVNLPGFGVMIALNQSIPCFNPAVGVCFDYGISPKRLLLNLFNQNKTRNQESEYTKTASKMNAEDLMPHLINWIISQYPFKKNSNLKWYLANDLPEKYICKTEED